MNAPLTLRERMNPTTIRQLMRLGWDTIDIANKFGLKEYEVWNVLANNYTLALPPSEKVV